MLSDIGSWASIFALPITIWVLIETFRIKKQFAARARLPEIRKSLHDESLAFVKNLRTDADGNRALENLAKILALLKNVKSKAPKSNHEKIESTIISISSMCEKREIDKGAMWVAYTSVVEITASLEQVEKDMVWK